MTAADLQRFLDERRMQRKELGAALAVSQDRLRRWLSGRVPIPRHIALACSALVLGLPEWPAEASLDPLGAVDGCRETASAVVS